MRTHLLVVASSWLLVSAAHGQRFSFGVVGGTAITKDFPTTDYSGVVDVPEVSYAYRFQFLSGPKSAILGAMVEGRISDRFSIEASVLRRPMTSTIVNTLFYPDGTTLHDALDYTQDDAWEFPVMFKYMLPSLWPDGHHARPFVEAGPSFRTQENAGAVEPSQVGISAGAGMAFRFGRIVVAPQLRYTRWRGENITPKYVTKADQLEFLTSLSFETDAAVRRLAGRRLEIGLIAGLPLTRGLESFDYWRRLDQLMGYLGGLKAEVKIAGNLSVEVNGLYKPLRVGGTDSESFSVITWQFPALAKYGWGKSRWKPFVEAGPSFRLSGNLNGYNPSHYGVTVGGGVERLAHGIRLSPALRYTRWAKDPGPSWPGYHWSYPLTKPNALELVFGISI